jgi:crotonobetainyl-CoA:carnitine CoA-transferase CaiB-like acyl-CoA transferase
LIANGAFVPPTDPSVPAKLVINHPVNITGMPVAGPRPAPELGQHTDEILGEMGFSAAEIAGLRDRSVV